MKSSKKFSWVVVSESFPLSSPSSITARCRWCQSNCAWPGGDCSSKRERDGFARIYQRPRHPLDPPQPQHELLTELTVQITLLHIDRGTEAGRFQPGPQSGRIAPANLSDDS